MNYTEFSDAISSSTANQSQPLASDDSSHGNAFSLAARILNGIIISILFTFGIATNIIVLHVLRRRGILLKSTSVILINLMITDLIYCLVVLPQDFAFYVLQVTFPRANEVFKVCFVLKTVMIFLNCSFAIVLSIERLVTATYVGKRRGNHLSKSLILCFTVIWLSSLGEAAITYYTVKDNNILPWKLSGHATSASSRCPSVGTIIAMLLLTAAVLTILFSFYRMRRFLRQTKQDADENSFVDFSKRLCRMHKRINLACLASLATLAISYLPMVTVILLWFSLERQSRDANAIVHVLCSMAHTSNPLIAIAMSRKIQSAFLKVLKSFYQWPTLQKWNFSLLGMRSNTSTMEKNNFQDNPCNSPIFLNESRSDSNTSMIVANEIFRLRNFSNRATTVKKTPSKRNSLPGGLDLRNHLPLKKTFSEPAKTLTSRIIDTENSEDTET